MSGPFVRVTQFNTRNEIWVNLAHVQCLRKLVDKSKMGWYGPIKRPFTRIEFVTEGGYEDVKEPPEEILNQAVRLS